MSIIRSTISAKASMHNFRKYQHGGYFTTADERAYFQHLRSVGCSNMEIAKLTGRSVPTVYKYIGKQPAVMSKANVEFGKAHHYQRLEERKQIVGMIAAQEHEMQERKKAALRHNIIDLTARLQAMREEYDSMNHA